MFSNDEPLYFRVLSAQSVHIVCADTLSNLLAPYDSQEAVVSSPRNFAIAKDYLAILGYPTMAARLSSAALQGCY